MNRDINGEFQAWFVKARCQGLLDLKFAIDDPSKSRREILEGFLDAEKAIEADLVYPPPTPSGVVHEKIKELIENS